VDRTPENNKSFGLALPLISCQITTNSIICYNNMVICQPHQLPRIFELFVQELHLRKEGINCKTLSIAISQALVITIDHA
jgi:hypothetical protein